MTEWKQRWQAEIAATKLPGVWRLKQGGHIVRARATDPKGRSIEIRKRLPDLDETQAFAWLQAERARIRSGDREQLAKQRYAEFASSLLGQKLATREIASARGREKWKHTLTHLIAGTGTVDGFGEEYVHRITPARAERWRAEIGALIAAGEYSPHTVNGWISIHNVIMTAARRQLQIAAELGTLRMFDTSEHVTFTEEEPGSLTADETRSFLETMLEEFPQHYAMACLGFATGLRPSHLRPLRRQGELADVKWDQSVILIRRSHTLGEIMDRTKTRGQRLRLNVPPELLDVLRWHVDTQLLTGEQQDSDYLFPADDGRPRSESCLKKPFAIVAALLDLKKKITPKAMRRTFNDLTRLAHVEGLVTRSISGHLTEQMRDHYSTVSPDEQRAAVGTVLRVIRGGADPGGDAGGDEGRRSGDETRAAGVVRA
jgi:integrase